MKANDGGVMPDPWTGRAPEGYCVPEPRARLLFLRWPGKRVALFERAVGGSALDLLPRGRVSAGLVHGLAPDTLEVPPSAVRETYGFSVRRAPARQAVATPKLLTSRTDCHAADRLAGLELVRILPEEPTPT
jgi:hypothetical protein